MIDSVCKASGILVVLVVIVGILISGTDDEFYAEEFTEIDNVVCFKVLTSTGGIRNYRIGGMYSVEKIDKPLRAPKHVRTAKHKVIISTDEIGMYFVTVYPVYQTNDD